MRKIIFCNLILILTFLTDSAFSQENKNKDSHHNIFLELGGMSYLGGSINYEYSFLISNFFRINPGLGIGYEYRSTDMNSGYYISFFPNLKILLGKNRHFFEAGIYANFAYDHEIGGIIGYRYALVKSPLFFRISLNRVEAATTTTIWGGLSIGVRL